VKQVNELLESSKYTVREWIGTLTTGPKEQVVGGELVKPTETTGVIIIQAKP
jgi:hypothetical protein